MILFLSFILSILSTSASPSCPWDFTISDLCSDFKPVLLEQGGNCHFDARDGSVATERRCLSNARAHEVCTNAYLEHGSLCYNRCHGFHSKCCCPPEVSLAPSNSPTTSSPTKSPTTSSPTTFPTTKPTLPTDSTVSLPPTNTKTPTNSPIDSSTESPTKSPVVNNSSCAWLGFPINPTCSDYECQLSAGNPPVWRKTLIFSAACLDLVLEGNNCVSLCIAFHVQCC
mmetsp:Transcript_62297/g.74973  ORF Transcript_62297/g.74973 Transcript_62297/m.74973 type:complete len:227 (+) Transcript_62297:37-717(+)